MACYSITINAEIAEAAEKTSTCECDSCDPAQKSLWIGTAAILPIAPDMRERLNALTAIIIAAALEVHRELGPGLLEHAYEACLAVELAERRLSFERQKPLPVVYKDQ